jgi:hypothetical protein
VKKRFVRRDSIAGMDCADCGTRGVAFAVPDEYSDAVPGSEPAVALCPRCLALQPATDAPADPEFDRLGTAFPTEHEAAVPMALLVGLLDSLALYRSEISELLGEVERAGVDPLLVLDRLDADPGIETELDLAGRRRQLEQLL